jgi:type IV pilus assembly protein PilW
MLIGSMRVRTRSIPRTKPRRFSQGLSIIELLVGVAIGLFILAGASAMFVGNVTNSRRLLIEARINQDLRSAMDLITRDLRRGAYWGNSLTGTVASGSGSTTAPNPYSAVTATGSTRIDYTYTRDAIENDTLDTSTEQFGFKLDTATHTVQMHVGGAWQKLTNEEILTIPNNGFTITPTETTIDIRAACAKTCTDTISPPTIPTSTQNCPRVQVRTYNIVLTGTSTTDSAVSRTLRSQVRVRNDALAGICPP